MSKVIIVTLEDKTPDEQIEAIIGQIIGMYGIKDIEPIELEQLEKSIVHKYLNRG